jgi:hypothetical protein
MPTRRACDERADLLEAQDLVDAGLLDVQDLALERQDRLRLDVAPLRRDPPAESPSTMKSSLSSTSASCSRAACGASSRVQRALAPGELARLARGLARLGRDDALQAQRLASAGCSSIQVSSASPTASETKPSISGLSSFSLGWLLNVGFGELHADDRDQALAQVLAGRHGVLSP